MTLIQFPDSRENLVRRNHEETSDEVKSEIGPLLIQVPENVNNIITQEYISPNEIIVITEEELKSLILDYIIYHLHRAKIALEGSILFSIQYISDLLFKIFLYQWEEVRLIVQNPYYTHWIEQWYPKRAWDASVYSYMFRSFENKQIQRDDYIPFAASAYLEYSKDKYFADGFRHILPAAGDMIKDKDFLKRWVVREI